MKGILIYLICGLAIVCYILLLSPSEKGDSIKEVGEESMKDHYKKVGKLSSSPKKVIGFNTIESSISTIETDYGISIIYELHNKGDQDIRIQFPSSQEYDYEIYNENGDLVYRYSDEHVFSQVISNVLFAKGQTLTFVAELPKLDKGKYKIIFWAAARGMEELKEEITVQVE